MPADLPTVAPEPQTMRSRMVAFGFGGLAMLGLLLVLSTFIPKPPVII